MKRLFLVISFCFLVFSNFFNILRIENSNNEEGCDSSYNTSVRLVDKNNVFVGNGVVYNEDSNYTYIVTSTNFVKDSYGVIFFNNLSFKSSLVGIDEVNGIAVLKTEKVDYVDKVCLANTNYISKGDISYLDGYLDKNIEYFSVSYLSSIGSLFSSRNNVNVYKNVLSHGHVSNLLGIGVYDYYGRLVGIVSNQSEEKYNEMYFVETNRLIKIVDSIVKTGIYQVNYIKYNIVDYSSLNNDLKKNYGVSEKVNRGVVVASFKPLKYVFGGLNQGMTIVAVNGVDVDNSYELDKQLLRYKKGSKVCLKVIKKNGLTSYYVVKI